MGCCCSCCDSDSVVRGDFTGLDEIEDNKEVQFEFDPVTGRLVPIIEDDPEHPPHHHHFQYQQGGAAGAAAAAGAGAAATDVGRSDDSLVDCMSVSNQSFDFDLDGSTTMRLTLAGDDCGGGGGGGSEGRGGGGGGGGGSGASVTPADGQFSDIESLTTQALAAGAAAGAPTSSASTGSDRDGGGMFTPMTGPVPFEKRVEHLVEMEEVRRSEVFAGFMVAVQMLRFAMKRITPTVRVLPQRALRMHERTSDGTSVTMMLSTGAAGAGGMGTGFGRSGSDYRLPSSVVAPMTPNEESLVLPNPSSSSDGVPSAISSRMASAESLSQQQQRRKSPSPSDAATSSPSVAAAGVAPPPAAAAAAAAAAAGPGMSLSMMSSKRVELLELDARRISTSADAKVKTHLVEHWDFFRPSPEVATRVLNSGDAIYAFKCCVGEKAKPDDIRLIAPITNLTCFRDEEADNNVPHVSFTKKDVKEDLRKYTVIISKAMYLLPGLETEDIDAAHWASRAYCEACIPGVSKFDDTNCKWTFRMHKPIVRFIFTLLIQLRVSEITDPSELQALGNVDGFVPVRALLYERTKRDKTKTDMTAKAKAVLLFQPVPGGMLVSNVAPVFNSAIPKLIASVINNFGGNGAEETAQVAVRTRHYIWNTFAVPRQQRLQEQREQQQREQREQREQQQREREQQQKKAAAAAPPQPSKPKARK